VKRIIRAHPSVASGIGLSRRRRVRTEPRAIRTVRQLSADARGEQASRGVDEGDDHMTGDASMFDFTEAERGLVMGIALLRDLWNIDRKTGC
jgi:hypothetical protein